MDAWKNPMYALGATRTNTQREQCQYARRAQCQGVWSREMIRTEQARRRQRRFG